MTPAITPELRERVGKDRPEDPHFIRRGGGWFRPAAAGYTLDITEAGLFSGEVARAYKRDVDGITIHPVASVRTDLANAIVRNREALARAEAAYEAACGEPAPTAPPATPLATGEAASRKVLSGQNVSLSILQGQSANGEAPKGEPATTFADAVTPSSNPIPHGKRDGGGA